MGVPERRPDDIAGHLLDQNRQLERDATALDRKARRLAAAAEALSRVQGDEGVVASTATVAATLGGYTPIDIAGSYGPEVVLPDVPAGATILVAASAELAVSTAANEALGFLYIDGVTFGSLSGAGESQVLRLTGFAGFFGKYAVPGLTDGDFNAGGVLSYRAAGGTVTVRLRYGAYGSGGDCSFRHRRVWAAALYPAA